MKEIDGVRTANGNKTKHYLSFMYDKARVRERLKHFSEATIVSVPTCIRSINVVVSHTTFNFFPRASLFFSNFIYQMSIVSCIRIEFPLSRSEFCERARPFIYLWISFFRNDWFHRLWISQLLNVRIISEIQWFNAYLCEYVCVCAHVYL